MIRSNPPLDPELEAFLSPGKIEPRLSPEMRANALRRARAIMSPRGVAPLRSVTPQATIPAVKVTLPAARPWLGLARIALAASVAVAVGAAGAVAALHRWQPAAEVAPVSVSLSRRALPVTTPLAAPQGPLPEQPLSVPAPGSVPQRNRVGHRHGAIDPFKAELAVLQPAHAAYEQGDFSGALRALRDHARAFPRGRLAEEREALRVESLRRLGRRDEAQVAARAFVARFPQSIFLTRVREGQP